METTFWNYIQFEYFSNIDYYRFRIQILSTGYHEIYRIYNALWIASFAFVASVLLMYDDLYT